MKKMGRPRGNNNMERVCTIRMDESTLKRLEHYCMMIDKAKSEVIREAINKYIDENDFAKLNGE